MKPLPIPFAARAARQGRRSAWSLALAGVLLGLPALQPPAWADSDLLESVKQNPQTARSLCTELKDLNGQGVSYTSTEAVARVAEQQQLNSTDAEILSTYVVGLYCPEVR